MGFKYGFVFCKYFFYFQSCHLQRHGTDGYYYKRLKLFISALLTAWKGYQSLAIHSWSWIVAIYRGLQVSVSIWNDHSERSQSRRFHELENMNEMKILRLQIAVHFSFGFCNDEKQIPCHTPVSVCVCNVYKISNLLQLQVQSFIKQSENKSFT